jgi:hydrogenase maturation factor
MSSGAEASAAAVEPARVDADAGDALAAAALALARRFAAGATMWCVAPAWPEHGRHVAVEFVHPVIMGKRALPAVSVDAADHVGVLRAMATSGDVLVLIGDAGTAGASALLRRAEAWGLTTVWIGAGREPTPGAADHVLWDAGEPSGAARFDGSVERLYHVLWELTHVCFEHPGLLEAPPGSCEGEVACVTCSDEGRPAEVLAVDELGVAAVRTAAGVESVDTTLLGPVTAGDLVLIHAGTAIAVMADEEHQR